MHGKGLKPFDNGERALQRGARTSPTAPLQGRTETWSSGSVAADTDRAAYLHEIAFAGGRFDLGGEQEQALARALVEIAARIERLPAGADWPVIYLSPRGRPLTQARVRRLAQGAGVTLLCGRFEGVDERVLEAWHAEELSLGDFVMTGGEIAAHALIDATVRLIPRVLGNQASTEEESFSGGLLEHPQYTRPTVWQGRAVPDILLSGHHAEIARWREAEAERLTQERRPDLWRAYLERQGRDPGGDREL